MFNSDAELVFMDALLCATEGKNPSQAIENQERCGQQSVVENQLLPKRINDVSCSNITAKEQYAKMGIVILEEDDDLFYNVQLPNGWQIEATDHSMWNKLVDDKGRNRAKFFYKAAFYDRDAFINFSTRFHISVEHIAPADADYEVWRQSDFKGVIEDGDTIIFETKCVPSTGDYLKDDEIESGLREQLEDYMKINYPNYRDINAYWD